MSSFYYRIKNLPGFSGLVVESDSSPTSNLMSVLTLIDENKVLGDRNLKIPVHGGMFILAQYLEHLSSFDSQVEFAYDNPWGKFHGEKRQVRNNCEVVIADYARAVTVNIIDHHAHKTLYSANFLKRDELVLTEVMNVMERNSTIEDLVFELADLKHDYERKQRKETEQTEKGI